MGRLLLDAGAIASDTNIVAQIPSGRPVLHNR
jgi:hypothetical protein